MNFFTHQITEIVKRKDLVRYLLKSDLKLRYKNKVLGFLWAVFDPFLWMLVYLILVTVLSNKSDPRFPVLLFAALLPYRWFAFSTVNNVTVLLSNSKLLQTVKFPFSILVINEVNIGLVNFFLGIIVLIPMLFIFQANLTINLLYFPIVVFFQYLFMIGIGLIFSVLGLYFRDLQNIMQFVVRILLYLSPAIYELSFVFDKLPEKYHNLYMVANPFASLLDAYKKIIVHGEPISSHFFIFIGYALILLLVGFYMFSKREYRFAKDL